MDFEAKHLITSSLIDIAEEFNELNSHISSHTDVVKLENRIVNVFNLCKFLYKKADKKDEAECLDLSQRTIMLYHDIDDLRISKSKIKIPINTSSIILN